MLTFRMRQADAEFCFVFVSDPADELLREVRLFTRLYGGCSEQSGDDERREPDDAERLMRSVDRGSHAFQPAVSSQLLGRTAPPSLPAPSLTGNRCWIEDAMKSLSQIEETLHRAMPELRRDFGLTRLALFGSYARGDAVAGSDVDVLVEVDPSLGLRFVDLAERIEALLGVEADVVSRRAISARHWTQIEKELVDVT